MTPEALFSTVFVEAGSQPGYGVVAVAALCWLIIAVAAWLDFREQDKSNKS